MTFEIPGVEAERGLALCDGDETTYLSFLRVYVSNMPPQLEKLRKLSEETLKEYTIAAHGVKGISEYIGAEEARITAKQLEDMGKNGDMAGLLAKNDSFINYAETLVANIKNWLAVNNLSE